MTGRILLALAFLACAHAVGAQPHRGDAIFLIAGPDLVDPNFHQTVVLVTRAAGLSGPLGVVINRPTEMDLARALPNAKGIEGRPDKVFFGGPVARNVVVFVFRAATPPKDAIAVMEGVYLGFDSALLAELLARDKPMEGLRVYAGHAAWAPGQLEAEVARGFWKSARPDARSIFEANPQSLWTELTRRASMTTVRLEPRPEATQGGMPWQ